MLWNWRPPMLNLSNCIIAFLPRVKRTQLKTEKTSLSSKSLKKAWGCIFYQKLSHLRMVKTNFQSSKKMFYFSQLVRCIRITFPLVSVTIRYSRAFTTLLFQIYFILSAQAIILHNMQSCPFWASLQNIVIDQI